MVKTVHGKSTLSKLIAGLLKPKSGKITVDNINTAVKVYVDGKEFEEYKKYNPEGNIIRCADGVQGNLCRVRNYILNEEFKNGADVVMIIDDDMEGLYLWQENENNKIKIVYKRVY